MTLFSCLFIYFYDKIYSSFSNWIEKKKCFFGARLIWILCARKRNDTALPDILFDAIFIYAYMHTYIHIFCVTYVRELRCRRRRRRRRRSHRPRALIAYQRGRRAIVGGIGRKAWRTWMHRITRALTQVAGARSAFLSCAWYHRSVRIYMYIGICWKSLYIKRRSSVSRQIIQLWEIYALSSILLLKSIFLIYLIGIIKACFFLRILVKWEKIK